MTEEEIEEKLIELLYFFQPCDPKIESLEHRTIYAKKIMKLINQTHIRRDTEVKIVCFHTDVKCAGYIIKTIAELIGEGE